MMIVLAVGMSSPDSMIAELTSTFVWPCMKASMVRSRAPSSICPCATAIVASGKGHVERAGNGGGRQGQHVDRRAQLADPLLVAHPEAMLLVDDQEAEPLEGDVLLEEPVRPDHDVEAARPQALDRPSVLGGRLEAGEDVDGRRVALEAGLEGLQVL